MTRDANEGTETVGATATLPLRSGELRVTRGARAGDAVRLEGPTFSVGSGPSAQLRLQDSGVSREHLRLTAMPHGILVQDAGSKNGTWSGTLRVERVVVTTTLALNLGGASLEIHVDSAPTPLAVSPRTHFGEAIGVSPAMRVVFGYLERAAALDVTILLEGENGVGKEVLANAIHAASPRAKRPFVTVDCGAIPGNLLESELFGHERGAFTGADQAKVGLFQQADGGTLFLDEVGELPIELQPKLLRAIEQREVRPVGGNVARPLDIRIVAATNRDLKDQVSRGLFREDLYYRLAMARVRVPSLRERSEDVLPIALKLLRDVTKGAQRELPHDVAALFNAHSWPGNVRELRNAIGRFALLGARDEGELFEGIGGGASAASEDLSDLPLHRARQVVVDRLEARYLPAVLAKHDGNVSKAAEHAQIARSSFYRLLARFRGDAPGAEED